jgi:2-polyprenyl-3-methyl-5-hydroxy-6-metoxy-1,4-benzoquinol methylase
VGYGVHRERGPSVAPSRRSHDLENEELTTLSDTQDDPTSRQAGAPLGQVQRQWNELGRTDPLWAVLTERDKKDGAWGVDEFLATGVEEIDAVMADVAAAGLAPGSGSALDFGCGAGRLVQALASHFDQVTGVDVARSMVATAAELNRKGTACRFVLNERPDLQVIPSDSMDFVYCCRVLQHMPTRLSSGYIAEFVRLLKPDTGVAVFQIPSKPSTTIIGRLMRVVPGPLVERVRKMQMHGLSPERVTQIVQAAGGEVVKVDADESAGPHWLSFRYLVRRPVAVPGEPWP